MSYKRVFVFVFVLLSCFIALTVAFSQEQAASSTKDQQAAPAQPVAPAAPAVQTEQPGALSPVQSVTNPEFQWVWGEVASIDASKAEFVIKYLDYETDQEKEMTIGTDDKTSYENVTTFSDIKPKDTLSIDYIVTADSKNLARHISVEQVEVSPDTEKWADVPQAQSQPAATPMNQ